MSTWKSIPGYEDLYEASDKGEIRSKEGKITSSARAKKRVWKQRILKQKYKISKNGRIDAMICLWKNGKPYYHTVARIIAMTFHGVPVSNKITVNHINGNTKDNSASNLEWMTLADNIKYGFDNGQYNNVMKRIKVIDQSGTIIYARSYSEMDRKLKRYRGYTSREISRGSAVLIGSNGIEYEVI